jgi:thiol:disulfide interchange protein DsbD
MHFDIHPSYRLGWLFGGDVGKPTAVRFSAPPGFEVGSVSFTGPSRFTLSGGLTSYGYKQQATAFAEVRAPLELSQGSVHRFNVEASWLACERECVAESTEAYFELETDPNAAEGVFSPELQAALASVPIPLGTLTNARFEWRTAATLSISAEGVKWLEFYPASERLKAVVAASGNALALEFQSRANREDWVGVAKAVLGGREVFVDLRPLK